MEKQLKENKRSPRKRIVNFLVHVLLAVLALIWVMPIVWIVLTSFRAEPGAYTNTFLPKAYTLNNYVKLLTDRNVLNFPRMFKNTLIIAICSCCISTSFVLSVSYSLSRMRFKFRKPYMNIAMILGLFPGFMTMIAQYFILKAMGLTEGSSIRIGLIIVYSACTGLGFQISKGFFDTIPKAIDEAAVIDGATQWQIFTKITMPLSKPIVIYTIMTSFIAPWVDFIFANASLSIKFRDKSLSGQCRERKSLSRSKVSLSTCGYSVTVLFPVTEWKITLQPKAVAIRATRLPILPIPTIPQVFPSSS